ncbi:TPA: hypothetical protein ACSP0P_001728 [Citrobacter freundii]
MNLTDEPRESMSLSTEVLSMQFVFWQIPITGLTNVPTGMVVAADFYSNSII